MPQFDKSGQSDAKLAVALGYDGVAGHLPKIVASGRGALAEQILELAFQNNVKVREDADLVSILATLDIDSDIPSGAVVAVAEILARVYAANQRTDLVLSPGVAP